ncbi:BTAD domain-containing putative transcriptional regulator [Nocardioides sp. C4-1]|uniref:ATP-binding protein n=1 Tax=Nocardioides sp. C4-1 TaxID=3151851 RepID=UPI0032640FA5
MLRLLDEVSYDGHPVAGERSQALLAALVAAGGRAVAEGDLVGAVWGTDVPANPAKALQVVVSRTRSQTAPGVVARVDGGYRLGLALGDVDRARLTRRVRNAVRAEAAGEPAAAVEHARSALDLVVVDGADVEALADLRADARADRATVTAVLGRSLAAMGEHDAALEALATVSDPDETTLAALLRSEAAAHGAPAALARYEQHRARVRDQLGVDPGPVLQAVHAELLAADNPVRTGLQYDATPLVGRDDDVRRLRALVRGSRVTSILGPGGLGKTRLAHLLGREAEQPVVHFVELAGVASPDDVVGEVGSALGVRDSVSGRRVLTVEQRNDVRGRIAQQLGSAPTLLILDNCEHVVEAVADLVAPLVAATRDLRVVTTTRAPLGIAAERVFALDQLDDVAAVELFRQRAEAARPGVRLDDDAVGSVVSRLDGLPLAIELAAAKVRAMSVADIDRRLDDRFALLRGHDRGAPDRHQTLLAVIDWSWNLLDDADRRALRRLSVFHDGFSLDGAEAVVGPDVLSALESLAGQSLLTVRDGRDELRYRMLETVREFGRDRLVEVGEEDDARLALRSWARAFCVRASRAITGAGEIEAIRAVTREENNLADVLRESLADGDQAAVVEVLGALGTCWTARGEHPRVIALVGAVDAVLEGWEPPAGLREATARATGMLVMNTAVIEMDGPVRSRELFAALGPHAADAGTRALAVVMETLADGGSVADLVDHPDRHVAMLALQWESHDRENDGDAGGAVEASEQALALWQPDDGRWLQALQHTQLAGLLWQQGRTDLATHHARAALDTLDALEADDDAIQLRAVLASAAISDGDRDTARRLIAEIEETPRPGLFGGRIVLSTVTAELALAEGRHARGLALYRDSVEVSRSLRFPGLHVDEGLEPWLLFAESGAVAAFARHSGDDGADLHAALAGKLARVVDPGRPRMDFPVAGSAFFAVGLWSLLREHDVERGVALLAVADRFSYSRTTPSLAWAPARAEADAVAPGALDAAVASYDGRRGPAALGDARALVAR